MTSSTVLLLCAVLGLVASRSTGSTSTAAPSCDKQEIKTSWTLDRASTLASGAVLHLLSSFNQFNLSSCAKACCADGRCDVGLFDEEHNKCFLLNCEPLDKCVWAHHHLVTSIPTLHAHSTNAIEDMLTPSQGADITSAADQHHLQHLFATSSNNGADTITKETAFTTNSVSSTDGKDTTRDVSSGSSTTGTTHSEANIQSASDNIAKTIVELALKNNITDADKIVNMTRDDMNKILAELIVKSGLTDLTRNGVAFTISQLTDADLQRLVVALGEKEEKVVPTGSPDDVDPDTRSVIASLAEVAGLAKSDDVKKMTRTELNHVVADLIIHAKATNLTKNGAAFTVAQLSEEDLRTLVKAYVEKTLSEPELDRNRGDPGTDSTEAQDLNASGSVSVAPIGQTGGESDTKTTTPGHQTTDTSGEGGMIVTQHDALSSDGDPSTTTRNATVIAILSLGCVLTILVFVYLGKRLYDNYERRHYNKIDHLINGIYQ